MVQNHRESPSYPVFRGLQRPLEFMMLRGRYIYWGAGTVIGGILGFLGGYLIAGYILALFLAFVVFSLGGVLIMVKQKKGLHSKKEYNGLLIFTHSRCFYKKW